MESYLTITQINDFIFCPRSLYYNGIYRDSSDKSTYHDTPQIIGLAHHKTIDDGTYSSDAGVVTGLMVYSERYNLLGRIDILDIKRKLLTERKYSVTAVYDGFRYQLYAQYFALTEMGYQVEHLRLHSKKDNRNYDIPLPDAVEISSFELMLDKVRSFRITDDFVPNPNKCAHCIYASLCDCGPDVSEEEEENEK